MNALMHSTGVRSTLLPWLMVVMVVVVIGCDRREMQPRQESDTDTIIADPAAIGRAAGTDPLPPPATSPCAGMTGLAAAECRERERQRAGGEPRQGTIPSGEDGPDS